MVDDPTLHAILASLNEGDGDDTLGDMRNGLDRLEELSDPKLASLICCKEGIAKMKDRIVVEDPEMRAMFILRLGKVIVRTLLIVGAESFDIEGYVRVESRTESRRMIEDFMDMATDVMKSFALGALGKAPAADSSQVFADNIECCNAYCEVLTLLLNSYNSAFEPLDSWTDALIGVAGSGSLSVHTSSRVAIRSSALSLLPVLKPAIAVAFKDRYQLITRCRQMPSYSYAPLRLVSAFMRTLLTDVSYTASILTVLDSGEADSGAGNVFGSGGSADFLEGSRLSGTCTPVQQYVSEWVESVLVKLLVGHVVSGEEGVAVELCAIIKDIILLTQHRIMATTRQEVLYHSPILLFECVFYFYLMRLECLYISAGSSFIFSLMCPYTIFFLTETCLFSSGCELRVAKAVLPSRKLRVFSHPPRLGPQLRGAILLGAAADAPHRTHGYAASKQQQQHQRW